MESVLQLEPIVHQRGSVFNPEKQTNTETRLKHEGFVFPSRWVVVG